jgi:hypothetical protein
MLSLVLSVVVLNVVAPFADVPLINQKCFKSSSFELRLIERLAKQFFYSLTKKHLMKLQVDKMTLNYSFLKRTLINQLELRFT